MASHYSTRSTTRLNTTHPDLQRVMVEVDDRFPNTILEGVRTEEQQAENVAKGVSRTTESKHLPRCSTEPDRGVDAVDAAPDPLSWPDIKDLLQQIEAALEDGVDVDTAIWLRQLIQRYSKDLGRWYYFGGYVLGVADQLHKGGSISTRLRWLGDADGDREIHDQSFDDLPHFERLRS